MQAGNLVGLPWDDLFNVLENPDLLSPEWIKENESTLKQQLQILCGTLQVEASFLKISQVALSVDEATFAVGQLVAYEPEAMSALPLAEEIVTSLACSLKRGWQIHHGVGKFAANALTVLVTCENAEEKLRARACDLLLDALGGWLKDHKKCNEKVEEVCGCHCRRASTAACCFLDRVFARPDDLLKAQATKFPGLIEMITDLHVVVRDEYGCPFSLTSMLQIPGVMDAVFKAEQPTLYVLDDKPFRLAEACMACLSYAMLTVDDHFFTDQSVRCFLKFADYGNGQGFQRLMSQPISLFMLEGLFPAACCLPPAATLMKKITSHPLTIRCVLSLLLAVCTPSCGGSSRMMKRRSSKVEMKPEDQVEHRRQATLHLKVMAIADTLHPKKPRSKSCLSDAKAFLGKSKKRCPDAKDKKESGGESSDRRLCAKPHTSKATSVAKTRHDSKPSIINEGSESRKGLSSPVASSSRRQPLEASDSKSRPSKASDKEESMSPQLSKLQADIEKLKAEIKQMKTMNADFLDKKDSGLDRDVKEDPNSWRYFKTRAVSKLKGETCTSLALSSHPGIPPWPNMHVERDPAIAWLIMEMLVGEEKAREVVKWRLSLVEVCKWLQRRLFCIHQGGQDPHEEEPLVLIECDRKGNALEELRKAKRNEVGIFGDISGQIEVHFKNESANGPAVLREWFVHASQYLAMAKNNLLVSRDKGVTLLPSPSSHISNAQHLDDFYILGRLVGLAIFKRVPMALRFHPQFCKLILNGGDLPQWTHEDIKELDPDLYRYKVNYILENPVEDLDLYFTDVLDDRSGSDLRIEGAEEQVDLIENGSEVRITEDNKKEYVRRVCEWRLHGCMRKQVKAFLEGFHTLIPAETVSGLNAVIKPLDFANLIAGLPFVDANDWEKHSRCSGGYAPSDKQVKWFWEVVHEFSSDQRAALLHFVTGSRNPPVGGFARLQGFNGDQKFTISKISCSIDALPSAHACICTIDLPEYTSKQMLRERIMKAVMLGGIGFNGQDGEEDD
mmetsp:Transcript_3231/g.6343  ORF Transcript_3231/g.6343 Transcript_3231/m.6343 type:complete len:1014 (-) Transcript_3231:129-3170(-)|eukprot:CAMPEP_0167779276 /NCGR_PEP_ID=MMETSP0111_2-20121227/4719_1 /TAXON_ID=91324 /ORGANISM="Lotharella globosa, Strain CCCM811" /LENGTH=1013 /DNA_ID=CAMNT_0007669673 /DNA_START=38 /DNA_END=3079 /DNA_ORIENTATION=+